MRILVLGSGAKEHALVWMISKSKRISGLYAAPGNVGTDEICENLPELDPADPQAVLEACKSYSIDYVFCGIEEALKNGVVDTLKGAGIASFGPPLTSAQLESDKGYAKAFMEVYGIPTTPGRLVKNSEELCTALEDTGGKRMVIKKNGLSRSRIMFDSTDPSKLQSYGERLLAEDIILLEEYHIGVELSIFVLSDGKHWKILASSADYKRAEEGDKGAATNGMGAIAPVPLLTPQLMEQISREIIGPTFEGMEEEGLSYRGVLFFGIILTQEGPKLLEYHVRFGDPEAQVIMPLLSVDFGNLIEALEEERLDSFTLSQNGNSAVGVVLAAPGYPEERNQEIQIPPLPSFPERDNLIFFGRSKKDESSRESVCSGRCLTVVGLGNSLINANTRAYEAVKRLAFRDAKYRTDIGNAFFSE